MLVLVFIIAFLVAIICLSLVSEEGKSQILKNLGGGVILAAAAIVFSMAIIWLSSVFQ